MSNVRITLTAFWKYTFVIERKLCSQCMEEALTNKQIRVVALSFIELADIRFTSDRAIDFKLCIAPFDKLSYADNSQLLSNLEHDVERVYY
jgi:hypothetical protein